MLIIDAPLVARALNATLVFVVVLVQAPHALSFVVSMQYSYPVAPDAAPQLSVGAVDCPVTPLVGAVLPNAPGAATCVVKLQNVVLAPLAYVVPPAFDARACQ